MKSFDLRNSSFARAITLRVRVHVPPSILLLLVLNTILICSLSRLIQAAETSAFQISFSNSKNEPEIMRAWTCHGRNQREMVDRLRQAKIVKSQGVYNVLCQVDRIHYAPANSNPYQDAPQVLGWGQTISAPHMHAAACEEIYPYLKRQYAAHPMEPLKILDVGCGSGYLTACLGRLVHAKNPPSDQEHQQPQQQQQQQQEQEPEFGSGKVYGIDIYPQLVQMAIENIRKADADLLEDGIVEMKVANGWEGLPDDGPFDAIHVGASAADFPKSLAQQLKPGGVLVVPVGPQGGIQYLYRIERLLPSSTSSTKQGGGGGGDDSEKSPKVLEFNPKDFQVTKLLGVRYVPLVQGPVN